MKTKIIGIFFLLLAIVIFSTVAYRNSHKSSIPVVFSPKNMLSALWENYKMEYWEADTGRTLDKQRDNITTSEGQSYTMLRAVWQDDRPVFDKTWQWTNTNLQRPNEHIFSWLYGKKDNGSNGILENQGGQNSASDADTDIAVSLLFAYSRWGDTQYLAQAKAIIADIWDKDVVEVAGSPIMAANNVEKNDAEKAIINPSYLAPYAYRMFAQVDPTHDWMKLVDSSYTIIGNSMTGRLGSQTSAGLPPDWVSIDKTTGQLSPVQTANYTTNFSFDALRLPWRLALDYKWYNEPRAKQALDTMKILSEQWSQNKMILADYAHTGQPNSNFETAAMYGGSIGYFLVSDPPLAKSVYENKLQVLFNPDTNSWKNHLNYYDANWAWFGLSLYHDNLPNLASNLNQSGEQKTTQAALQHIP